MSSLFIWLGVALALNISYLLIADFEPKIYQHVGLVLVNITWFMLFLISKNSFNEEIQIQENLLLVVYSIYGFRFTKFKFQFDQIFEDEGLIKLARNGELRIIEFKKMHDYILILISDGNSKIIYQTDEFNEAKVDLIKQTFRKIVEDGG